MSARTARTARLRARFAQLLHGLGFAKPPDAARGLGEHIGESQSQPRVEAGSTLDTIAALNPANAALYADAVERDIKQAIAACSIGDSATTTIQALEQIHGLKNAIAPTGAAELLKACEQLRLDASHSKQRAALAQRFKEVASAAVLLVKNYRRTLS
jgi:hypothetical protein